MKRGGVSAFKPVKESVLAGTALLWLAAKDNHIHAAAVTEINETEWRRTCVIVACSGRRMTEWLPLIAAIEKFARTEGCAGVQIMGRPGWERALKEYRRKAVVLEKELA
jgi:hypothetical protein